MKKLTFSVFALMAVQAGAHETLLPSVEVQISADASKDGLAPVGIHDHLATKSRVGVFGNQDHQDSAFSQVAYTQQMIADTQAKSVSDVIKHDSGVAVSRGFGNFQEAYLIRGQISASDDVMYNGMYGILPRQYIAADVFERVELQKGAGAAINGASPFGGAGGNLSLLPKRAQSTPTKNITIYTENLHNAKISADIAQRFLNDTVGVRVNAAAQSGGSAINKQKRSLGVGVLGLDYHADGTRLSLDFGIHQHKLKAARPSVSAAVTPNLKNAKHNFAQSWTHSDEKDRFISLRGEQDFGALTAFIAYGNKTASEHNVLANPSTTDIAGNGSIYQFNNARKDKVSSHEIGVRGQHYLMGTHTWSASINGYHAREYNDYVMDWQNPRPLNINQPTDYTAPFITSNLNPKLSQTVKFDSIAIADHFAIGKVNASLVLRHQKVKKHDATSDVRYNASKVLPSFGINYEIMDGVNIYANHTQGVKAGRTIAATPTTPAYSEAPYIAKSSELGVKFDKTLGTADIGGIVSAFTSKSPKARYNGVFGTESYKGVELSGYIVRGDTKALGGITVLNAKQNTSDATNGKYVIGAAKTSAKIGVEQSIRPDVAVSADIWHIGARYIDELNTQKVPAFTTIDLGARIERTDFGVPTTYRVALTNVANKAHWAGVGGYPGAGYLVAGEPRTLKLSAGFKF